MIEKQCVLQVLGIAKRSPSPADAAMAGQYLVRYDVDAHDGVGEIWTSDDITDAMRFDSAAEAALAIYQSVPKSRPLRDDGKPNRPLTAYHLAILPYPGS